MTLTGRVFFVFLICFHTFRSIIFVPSMGIKPCQKISKFSEMVEYHTAAVGPQSPATGCLGLATLVWPRYELSRVKSDGDMLFTLPYPKMHTLFWSHSIIHLVILSLLTTPSGLLCTRTSTLARWLNSLSSTCTQSNVGFNRCARIRYDPSMRMDMKWTNYYQQYVACLIVIASNPSQYFTTLLHQYALAQLVELVAI